MVSSTLISLRPYWPREGKTKIGCMVSSITISFRGQDLLGIIVPFWYYVDHIGPERARLNWVYGKFYFDIIQIILAQRGQDSIGYMVSSTLIFFRPYWLREGNTQFGIW